MKRKIAHLLVVALALSAVVAATRARRLGLRVESFAVAPGEDPERVPEIGDDLPEAPFRYAEVGAVRGDHGALAAAMDAVRARGGVDFVILRGDVLGSGGESECRKIAAAFRDRGVPVLAAPGPNDRARADAFQRWIGPLHWSFLHKARTFDSEDFAAGAAPQSAPSLDVVVRQSHPSEALETMKVRRPSAGGIWRDVAFGVLFPLVRSTEGYAAVLLGSLVIAASAITGLPRAPPAAPRGTASRTAS